MSNIRQRRAPSPSRDNYAQSSTSWGIATENSGDNAHSSARSSIPMYNPMTMQSSSSKSSTPSSSVHSTTSKISHRTSWNTITEAKKSNAHDNSLAITYHDSPGYYTDSVTGKGRSAYDSLRSGRNLPSMSPKLIPDSAYRTYLSGQTIGNGNKSVLNKLTIAKIIGCFSIVGFIFLTFVGILIDTQPMFLQGILTKNEEYSSNGKKMKTFYAVNIVDRLEPAKHAYRGGLLYLFTSILCLGYAHNMHHFLFKKGWQQYRDIDDVDSTVPTFHHNGDIILGAKDDYLPTNGAIHRQAYEDHNGFIVRAWHSTSVTFQRAGIYLESIWQARRRNRRRFAGAKDV
jgi:hypothetical protein